MLHNEYAPVKTSMQVLKWDAEQAAWASRRADKPADQLIDRDFSAAGVAPYETWFQDDVNMVLAAGWAALLGSIAGTSITTKWSASVGRIGVGDSTTLPAFTQTDLQATTNKFYQTISAAPTISVASSPATLVFAATFAGGNANFAWNEFITDQGTASGSTVVAVCLNRGAVSMGTKASAQIWTATETIQFGFASNPT